MSVLTIKGVVAVSRGCFLPVLYCNILNNSLSLKVMIDMEGPLTIELVQDFRLKGEFTSE
jgi:hypothetical protein